MRIKSLGPLLLAAVVVLIATVVGTPAPVQPVAGGGSDIPVSSRTIALGSAQAPAPGAIAARQQPVGVPLAAGLPRADDASDQVLRRTQTGIASFSAVGVSWKYAAASVTSVALRTKAGGDRPWSNWHATTAEATGRTTERDGTGVIWTGPATAVDVVVTSTQGAPAKDVRVGLIDPGRRAADVTDDAPEITLKADRTELNIRSRSQWGADEKLMTWKPEYAPKVAATVVHHTATTTDYSADQVPAILRSIYRYHAFERGWGDIGYNIIVDKFGRAWEGRAGGVDKAVVGAHAQGFNTGTSGLALIGNYVGAKPTSASLETMSRTIAYKLGPHGTKATDTVRLPDVSGPKHPQRGTVSVPAVMGHDVVGRTACPGRELDAALPALRARAAALTGSIDKLTTAVAD